MLLLIPLLPLFNIRAEAHEILKLATFLINKKNVQFFFLIVEDFFC